jgi:hypothetical protein
MKRPILKRAPLLGWSFNDTGQGVTLHIVRGHNLVGDARKGAITGRWYITFDRTKRVGNRDGSPTLREVRDHIAAVLTDRAKGYEVVWG